MKLFYTSHKAGVKTTHTSFCNRKLVQKNKKIPIFIWVKNASNEDGKNYFAPQIKMVQKMMQKWF